MNHSDSTESNNNMNNAISKDKMLKSNLCSPKKPIM